MIEAIKHFRLTRRVQRLRVYEPLRFALPTALYVARNPRSQLKFALPWIRSWMPGNRLPWWSYGTMMELDRILREKNGGASVFEYGSGYSTRWLASRCARVTSIESDPVWYGKVRELLNGFPNAEIHLVPSTTDTGDADCLRSEESTGCFDDYVRSIDRYPDDTFDLVTIDGFSRNSAMEHARCKVRPGGYLFLDDAQRVRYKEGLALFDGWSVTEVSGIRPRSLPNTGMLLRRPH